MKEQNKAILRRVLSFCVLVSIVFSSFAFCFAQGAQIVYSAPKTMPKSGETFSVKIDIIGNPGFSALGFTFAFDHNEMECLKVNSGSLISKMLCAANPNASNGAMLAAASTDAVKGDGNLAIVEFRAKKDIKSFSFELKDITLSNGTSGDIAVSIGKTSSEDGKTEVIPQEPTSGTQQTAAEEIAFTDTVGHWSNEYVLKAAKKGLVNGVGGGLFAPNEFINRAELVTLLYRLKGSPSVTTSTPFTDISKLSKEFTNAVNWAYANKVVGGVSETEFDPYGYATREEVAKVLFNLSGAKSGTEMMFSSVYDSTFIDSADIAAWAKPAMNWAIYNKILGGTTANTISPKDFATRAEIAKIVLIYSEM